MLSVNKKISRNASYADITWLRKPELKIKEVFNWQIFKEREVLMEVTCGLGKKKSHELNKFESKEENSFNWKIDF